MKKPATTFSSIAALFLASSCRVPTVLCGFSLSPEITITRQRRSTKFQAFPASNFDDKFEENEAGLSSVSVSELADPSLTRQQRIRAHGGPLAFDTKYGAINPYGLYFGLVSIVLGLVWFVALSALQLLYNLTDNIDPQRRLVVLVNHLWGTCLLRLTGNYPQIENAQALQDLFQQENKAAAMVVANHNSWMDIPYVGAALGWRNYRFVAKKEIAQVPILGQAITMAKSVLLDRANRRSQLQTLKQGMQCLSDDRVPLVAFPEGTRSPSGRLQPFKNGAFKMAHKTQSPVVPLSIVASGQVMPPGWIFPFRPGQSFAKVVVHPPIDSIDYKTEEELARAVRRAILSGLPQDQQPLLEEAQ